MDIVSRVKNILVTPNTEWPVIAGEPTNTGQLYSGYIIPLAAIGPIASFIGFAVSGAIAGGIVAAIVSFVVELIAVFIIALILTKIAPMFGGRDDLGQAFKLAAYSRTPAWLGAIFGIVPILAVVGSVIALYGIYLLYSGAAPVLGVPKEKTVLYTVVAVIVSIVTFIVLGLVVGVIFGTMLGLSNR
jgi:hypothetical protein